MVVYQVIRKMIAASTLLLSGCLTISEVESWNRSLEEVKKNENKRMLEYRAGQKLIEDFEVVFRDADYLSTSNTPARMALGRYFLRRNEKNPSPEQFARLVDRLKERTDLLFPLKDIWLSPHATVSQRVEFALLCDHTKWHMDSHNLKIKTNELLENLLPYDQIDDTVFSMIQNQVTAKGYVYEYVTGGLDHHAFVRQEGKDWTNSFRTKREKSRQREQVDEKRRQAELERREARLEREMREKEEKIARRLEWQQQERQRKRACEEKEWGTMEQCERTHFYQDFQEEVAQMHQSTDVFKRDVLPLFADKRKRKMMMEVLCSDTNSIPIGNLRAIADWSLQHPDEIGHDAFLLMIRPEFSPEILREYFPALMSDFKYHSGLHGLLCNGNVPKELSDQAYRAPQFSWMRRHYFLKVYYKEDVLKYDYDSLQRAFDTFSADMRAKNLSHDQYCQELDRFLKRFLPEDRPEHWLWRFPGNYRDCGYPPRRRYHKHP